MPSVGGSREGPRYWRSLDELADTPEFRALVEREFPGMAPDALSPTTRRTFLKLMGASLAMAGLAGCRWPEEKIVPYARRPDGRTPGKTESFATSIELAGVATGVLATSYDGRPIKIEGNPQHPFSQGAASALAQASVLELYDPDRLQQVMRRTTAESGRGTYVAATWDDFAAFARDHFAGLQSAGGAGLAFVNEPSSSPSLADMQARIRKAFPKARWCEYEPLSRYNELAGAVLAFGKPVRTHLHLDQAEVIVSLDADFLAAHPAAVRYARDFARGRTAGDGRMNRLYVVESRMSLTGAQADERLATKPTSMPTVAAALLSRVLTAVEGAAPSAITQGAGEPGAAFVEAAARDLLAHRGHGVVVAGPQQPAEVHAFAHRLNAALGNVGRAITYTTERETGRPPHTDDIAALAVDMNAGRVSTLVILGGNPVYNAPSDVAFGEALRNVATTIHLTLIANETSQACAWELPKAHALEAWGDARAYDGTLCTIQPLIAPIFGGKTPIELLALIAGEPTTNGYEIVRRTLQPLAGGGDFETFWNRLLHDGLLADSADAPVTPELDRAALDERLRTFAGADGGASSDGNVEVDLYASASVYDGRFANNAWLQELSDPITKLTWGNAAMISVKAAQERGLRDGDVVALVAGSQRVELPVVVVPGQADGVVSVALGYGRTMAGVVGSGVGVSVYPLRTRDAMHVRTGVKIEPTGRRERLAMTQDHHVIDRVGLEERGHRVGELVRDADLARYQEEPDFAKHVVHSLPLKQLDTEPVEYTGHRWAMAIDLTKCTGCNACVVACQAENNVPVVGRDEVIRSREMHWLRVDRYFTGPPESPKVAFQPLPCQQCENAPCEPVCPVAATVHSHEGLNDMVYNRCIGTRYCSNNCPYKVRRFNYFWNHHGPKHPRGAVELTDLEKMVYNPDVTMRSRGVMEKCTYCVQRIEAVKIRALVERRPIQDGEIVPACQQTCPTEAIVFGDLNDPRSRVAALHADSRAYAMLEELNVRPRTKYLAKLRNPAGGADTEGHA